MYIKKYLRRRMLVEQKLVQIYGEKETRKLSKKFVYETYADDWIGVSEGTFTDHCNTEKYDFPGEEAPLYVEAMLRSIGRNREMAWKYENGLIRLSEIPYPEFKDLIEAIKERKKKPRK